MEWMEKYLDGTKAEQTALGMIKMDISEHGFENWLNLPAIPIVEWYIKATEEVAEFDAEAFKLDIMDSVATLIQAEVEKFAKTEKVGEIEKAVGLITDIVEKMAATPKEEPTKKVPNPFNKGTNYAEIAEKMRAAITKK